VSNVFVVDTKKQPLNPVHPGYARLLLRQGRAAVYKRYPFTLILKAVVECPKVQPLRLKIDPGSRTTGIVLVNDASGEVVFAAHLEHRGAQIKQDLDQRRRVRRGRRQRKTRYRQPRFLNRRRRQGWLPPSLESRSSNIVTWVERLRRLAPIIAISQELVRFDLQALEHPEISGVEYQQGTREGYEVREYLLEKWGRKCAYCDTTGVPLQVEHIRPRAKQGGNRLGNLCLACEPCNQAKGTLDIEVFLTEKPELLKKILDQAQRPLKDAAAVNSTRWSVCERLKALDLPVECGSGGLTKYNRTTQGLPKEHWIDAACVGQTTPEHLCLTGIVPLEITAKGHGCRQKCNVNAIGFPRSKPKGAKKVKGFQTGDLLRAVVPAGSKQGSYVGRVSVRASGSFDIRTKQGRIQGINARFCTPIHRSDGYTYHAGAREANPTRSAEKGGSIPPPHE